MHTYIRLFSGYFLLLYPSPDGICAFFVPHHFIDSKKSCHLAGLTKNRINRFAIFKLLQQSLNYYSNLYGLFITFKFNFEFYMFQIKSSPLVIIAHIVRAFLFANATTARLNPLLVFNSFSQLALLIGKFLVWNNTALAP